MRPKLLLSLALGLALCFASCQNDPPNHLRHDPNYTHGYICPMKCEKDKTYEQPGKCPVCHLKLAQREVRIPAPSADTNWQNKRYNY